MKLATHDLYDFIVLPSHLNEFVSLALLPCDTAFPHHSLSMKYKSIFHLTLYVSSLLTMHDKLFVRPGSSRVLFTSSLIKVYIESTVVVLIQNVSDHNS